MNIIDIGSNSVRRFDGVKKTIVTSRLAADMKEGRLDAHSISRTVNAVISLSKGECVAFATEAVRKAVNKAEFLSAVKAATGIDVDIISGETEAKISYLGATGGRQNAAVVDLGGASCEIIFGEGTEILFARSFPFGCVTMADRFGNDLDAITRHVSDLLFVFKRRAENYIAVGGTATSLAAMALGLTVYDPDKVDGYNLYNDKIVELIGKVRSNASFPTLSESRRKSIVQGATVLLAVMNRLNIDFITLSEKDNLEGYALYKNLK